MMTKRNTLIVSTLSLCTLAGSTLGAGTDTVYPDAIASPDELFMNDIAERMFVQLPQEHQVRIARAGGIGSGHHADTVLHFDDVRPPTPDVDPDITAHEYLELIVSDRLAERMTEAQWTILNTIADTLDKGELVPHMCFAPDTDPEYAYAINQLIELPYQNRFQQTGRWTFTATDGGGLSQGTPTTLTYSFVPDGTFVPDLGIGLGSGPSQLFAWMDGIYNGNTQQWQDLFHQVFDRWEELIGTTYVFEPNDDGSNTNSAGGQLGVRGDVRIAAFDFQNDGNGGVLAYNNFPNDGDMVFDAFDTFYNTIGNNSIRLRNVAAHEHGHGLGMLHVCPVEQSKLMEPFVSTAFDGPQLDDILNGIRHYGDNNEPDNSIAEATDLGGFSIGGSTVVTNVGIDDNSDQDYFRISVSEPARIVFTAGPDAGAYDQGPQTSQCNTGVFTDYNSIQDLRIVALDSGGGTLGVADNTQTGDIETLAIDVLTAGEEIFFVVDGATNVNNVQRYQVSVIVTDVPFQGPVIDADTPNEIDPGVQTSFSVSVDPREDDLVAGSAQLFTSINGEPFSAQPLVDNGNNSFTATLPSVLCDDSLAYFIAVEGDTDGVVTLPEGGASDPFRPIIGDLLVAFEDNFETDQGWLVTGNVPNRAAGRWERGVPAGDGSRGDAPNDADGSGSCYLTGNGGPGSNTDVDNGQTILNSPVFNLAGETEAILSYSRWYDNTGSGQGADPGNDIFTVEISNDAGVTWTTLEVVGPSDSQSSGGWFDASFRVADFVEPTNAVLVRFIAEDAGDGSVIEAAVDAVRIEAVSCEDPDTCPADFNGDGSTNFFDVSAYLGAFNSGDLAADFNNDGNLNFFDVSGFLGAFNAGCP